MTDAYCRFICGDALTEMRKMPDDSVDLVLTSPPFLALRSYLPADHPDKAREMGSEATPGAYIDALLTIVEEARRVLAAHGSICVELGDTFSGSGGAGGDYGSGGMRDGQPPFRQGTRADNGWIDARGGRGAQRNRDLTGWPLDKSLSLIPESLRWAMVYGRNPFTGRETPRWRVRNVVRWVRPNPPVGALGDKFRPATTEMVVACMSRERWFDLDAVRTEPVTDHPPGGGWMQGNGDGRRVHGHNQHPAGAPPLDWWQIPTEPYPGAHYATWPRDLCVVPIQAMCPRRVCVVCGEPSRRVVETTRPITPDDRQRRKNGNGQRPHPGRQDRAPEIGWEVDRQALGWTDCGHGDWRAGVVLDMFAGSGTTLAVAQGHGRSAIGVDLDPRNAELARTRIGMFLTVEGDDEPRPVTDAPASLLQGGSMGQSLGGRTGDGESSA